MKKQATILFIALLTFLAPLNTQGTSAFIDIIRPNVKQANLEHQIALAQELIPLSKNKEERKAMEARIAELKQEIFNHKLYSVEKRKKLLRIVGLILASGAVTIPVGIAGYRHFKKPKAAAPAVVTPSTDKPASAAAFAGTNPSTDKPVSAAAAGGSAEGEDEQSGSTAHSRSASTDGTGDDTPPPSTPVALTGNSQAQSERPRASLTTLRKAIAESDEDKKRKGMASALSQQDAVPFPAFSPAQPTSH
jgi:hypothetical protein